MKYLIIIFTTYFLLLPTLAKHKFPEKIYQKEYCKKGNFEYKLNDNTRVDCLTNIYAIELDFASKWAECVGQSLYYALRTNKKPKCVLIIEDDIKDQKYIERIKIIAEAYNVEIETIKLSEKTFQTN